MEGFGGLTSIESIAHLIHQITETRNHFNLFDNVAVKAITPLQQIKQLLLNLRGSNVVWVEVICLRLSLQLLSLRHLVVTTTNLSKYALKSRKFFGGIIVLALIQIVAESSDTGLTDVATMT